MGDRAPIARPATMGRGVALIFLELFGLEILVSLVIVLSGSSLKMSAMVANGSVTYTIADAESRSRDVLYTRW